MLRALGEVATGPMARTPRAGGDGDLVLGLRRMTAGATLLAGHPARIWWCGRAAGAAARAGGILAGWRRGGWAGFRRPGLG